MSSTRQSSTTGTEAGNCRDYLERQTRTGATEVPLRLGACGAEPSRHDLGIGKLRGRFHDYKGIPVMCTYHPAFLLPGRSPGKKKDVWEDMKKLLERMGTDDPEAVRVCFRRAGRPRPYPEKRWRGGVAPPSGNGCRSLVRVSWVDAPPPSTLSACVNRLNVTSCPSRSHGHWGSRRPARLVLGQNEDGGAGKRSAGGFLDDVAEDAQHPPRRSCGRPRSGHRRAADGSGPEHRNGSAAMKTR